MFKIAVFNIQHLNSNREDFFASIFCIKLQERLIKTQCTHINKSYLKFRHLPELSHSVHGGINPASKTPYFLQSPLQIVQTSCLGNSPYIIVFL